MVSFVSGTLDSVEVGSVVIDNNGIGYRVSLAENAKLPSVGDKIKLFTYMNVKEDGISLFGFNSMEELKVFNMLISVSGIGPKGALAILGVLSPSEIMLAIITEDAKALSSAKGVGIKIAKRLILELKDKIKTIDAVPKGEEIQRAEIGTDDYKQDAIDALLVLGFTPKDVTKTVLEVSKESSDLEEIIKSSLKKLSGR